MTEEQVQAFCANSGISVSAPGQPLHVVDPENLPEKVRAFVNDDGSYKGSVAATEADAEEVQDEDLSALTVAELKDRARDLEISGFSSMTKDELVKSIKKAAK